MSTIHELPQLEIPTINLTAGATTPTAPATVPADTPESYVDREPVVTTATIVGVLSAVVTWLVARGLLGTADEAFALTIIPVAASILFAYYSRRSVTSVGRAKLAIDEAYAATPGEDAKPKL